MASSSSCRGGEDNEPCLVGSIVARIVCMRYHSGGITGREDIRLVRQPLNAVDGNAIAVFNRRGAQVGLIQRSVAAVLSPLIDRHILAAVQAIVPEPPSKDVFGRPCQVHLFARSAAFPALFAAIRDGGLDLIHADNSEFVLSDSSESASATVKEQTKRKPNRDVDELISLVGKEGKRRIKCMEAPREVGMSKLSHHQKEALGCLVHREESGDLPTFREEGKGGGFENILTTQNVKERPVPLKGGISADDMGLRKLLQRSRSSPF